MHRIFLVAIVFALAAPAHAQVTVEIVLKQGTPREAQTREQLQRLLKTYDVSPWLYTKSIIVDERAIPFSHPTLTLSARHLHDDELLLSTFVHEQFHWFLVEQSDAGRNAIAELRTMFPKVPAGGTEGARDENSTYLHLLVCYLEYRADQRLFGELKTKQIMDFWATDHYTWIYKTVLERSRDIGSIIRKHKLIPSGFN